MKNLALNTIEVTIKRIWETTLGIHVNELNLNFFMLGGNSIQAFAIANDIHTAFNVEFSISDFFDTLTIENSVNIIQKRLK